MSTILKLTAVVAAVALLAEPPAKLLSDLEAVAVLTAEESQVYRCQHRRQSTASASSPLIPKTFNIFLSTDVPKLV